MTTATWPVRLRAARITFATAIVLGLSVFSALLAGGFTIGYLVSADETAAEAGRRLFLQRQASISSRLEGLFDGPQFLAAALSEMPVINDGFLRRSEDLMLAALEFHPAIVNIKIGNRDGLYFSVSRIAEIPDTRYYTPPVGAAYAIVTVAPQADGSFVQDVAFRGRDLASIGDVLTSPSTTDVRKLDWFELGRAANGEVSWIGRVVPGGIGARISFLTGFDGTSPGAIGVDIGHRDIATVLAGLRETADEHLIVFDDAGLQYGSSSNSGEETVEAANAVDEAVFARFKDAGAYTGQDIEVGGRTFFASVLPIKLRDSMGVSLFAGIATSRAELEQPLKDDFLNIIALILVTLGLTAPLLYFLSQKLSEPLRRLSSLADDTLKLNFNAPLDFRSVIHEAQLLTQSFRRVQTAFRNICRFVPEAHVRRTVDSGAAQVFGERRNVSLLMTDVTDFTTIVERMEPEGLLRDMSDYFDQLNQAILAEGGTIDKYVGDAIFSYWNGVEDQAEHAILVCRAAVRMRNASRKLASDWKAAGKSPWATRIGVHRGDVVVGNVGSDTRMDFTVIGNAVNLASRIEGLNKVYGTEVLVSDAVRRDAGDGFLFRCVDVIRPKGIKTPTEIHELVGALADPELGPAPDAATIEYCATWNYAFTMYRARQFDEALTEFRNLAAERPSDPIAGMYIERCRRLLHDPPPADWAGVEKFDQK